MPGCRQGNLLTAGLNLAASGDATDGLFRIHFDHLPWPSYIWQRTGNDFELVGYNRRALDIAKETNLHQIEGIRASKLYPPDSEHLRNLFECADSGEIVRWEGDFEYVSGLTRRMSVTHVPLPGDIVVVHAEDVTEKWRSEEAVRASESRLRALYSSIPDVVLRMSTEGRFLDVHALDESQLAFPRDEIIGKTVGDFYGEAAMTEQVRLSKAAVETQEIQVAEYVIRTKRGESLRMESRFVASGPDEVLVHVRDVTERSLLASELTKMAERERSVAGRELHEGVAQTLVGLKLELSRLESELRDTHRDLADRASSAMKLLERSIVHTRELAKELSPLPENIRLADALWDLGCHWKEVANIDVRFEFSDATLSPGYAAKVHIYRFVHEGIANAVKHGSATEIDVFLQRAGEGLELTIADNGSGLDEPIEEGLGLKLLRFRALTLGGDLELKPRTGGGTELVCRAARAILQD